MLNPIETNDMNVEVKQLKDTQTGEVFVPLTHWDAVANKPEDIAKESTLLQESEAIKQAIASAKPEVDLGGVAKQGNNPEATLTAIYKLLIGSNEPSQDIPEGVAERLALILEFFGIKPIEAYEFMTSEEVCAELEDIMTSMDITLTQQQAAAITQQTLTQQ